MGLFKILMGEEPGLIKRIKNYENVGQFGEYMTAYALGNNNLDGYYKILNNVYVPYKGKTSEIDILMIHEKGVFVFENKNYSGWIFGSAEQHNWTQCLPNKEKHSFYNPIMQNKTHIDALREYFNIKLEHCISYITFSQRCELKEVPENTEKYIIIKRPDLLSNIRKKLKTRPIIATPKQIDTLYDMIYPLTQVTAEQKQKHIENIKKH